MDKASLPYVMEEDTSREAVAMAKSSLLNLEHKNTPGVNLEIRSPMKPSQLRSTFRSELTAFCKPNRKGPPLSRKKTESLASQRTEETVNEEEALKSFFYPWKEHDEVGQELRQFPPLWSQVIKEQVDDDVFVWKVWKSQHQQLCALLWSQETYDLQLKGSEGTDRDDSYSR